VNTLAFHHLGTTAVDNEICLWTDTLQRFVMFTENYFVGCYTLKNAAGESIMYNVKAVFYNRTSICLLCFSAVGTNNGVVRVVNRETTARSLVKGMAGMVQDIAFAHIPTEVVLASVDEYGNLLVHQIEEAKKQIMYP
jgi:hypothetical protein